MTREEIIKLANEAELCQTIWIEEDCIEIESVIQFAKLVAERALAQEKALQALHGENERLGLYKDAYAEPLIGCVNHDCDKCKERTEQEPVIDKFKEKNT